MTTFDRADIARAVTNLNAAVAACLALTVKHCANCKCELTAATRHMSKYCSRQCYEALQRDPIAALMLDPVVKPTTTPFPVPAIAPKSSAPAIDDTERKLDHVPQGGQKRVVKGSARQLRAGNSSDPAPARRDPTVEQKPLAVAPEPKKKPGKGARTLGSLPPGTTFVTAVGAGEERVGEVISQSDSAVRVRVIDHDGKSIDQWWARDAAVLPVAE